LHPGYILGEYGHLIANEPGSSPIEQFQVLHTKSQFCLAATRALLLSTYIKWVNVFPEIKSHLLHVFDRYRHVLDVDLQQRACEYYTLASRPEEDDLLQNVCEEIPPFPPRESALIGRLNRKLGDTENKRTWVHGGKEANLERELSQRANKKTLPGEPATGTTTGGADTSNEIMDSLAGLDLTSPSNDTPAAADPSSIFVQLSKPINPAAPRLTTGPNIDRWFEKLTYSADGVLYEDIQMQIGIKSRYQGHNGQLAIYMGNKVPVPLTSFTATVHVSDPDALSASFAKLPPSTIAPRAQTHLLLQVECKKFFSTPPNLSISFLAGSQQSVTLQLPILITKFFEHVSLGQADFFERWKLIGGPPRESQLIFPITLTEEGGLDLQKYRQVIGGHRLNLLDGIDPNLNNLVGAGILHTFVDGKVGCLLRFEPNQDAKVRRFRSSRKFKHQTLDFLFIYTIAMQGHRSKHIGRCGGGGPKIDLQNVDKIPFVTSSIDYGCSRISSRFGKWRIEVWSPGESYIFRSGREGGVILFNVFGCYDSIRGTRADAGGDGRTLRIPPTVKY